jgi:O-antigen/teichoic acid export membrane protein
MMKSTEMNEEPGSASVADSVSQPAPPSLLKTVFRNSAWSTLAVVASPILQFLFGGLTLRYVGVAATGFSLAVGAILGIAARFGTLGIGEAALPAIASALATGNSRLARRLIGIVFAVFGVASAVTATGMLLCADTVVEWSKTPVATTTASTFIVISCAAHVLGQMNLALLTVLRAASRYDLVTAVTTPLLLVSGVVACMLVPMFPSLITVALLGLLSSTAAFSVALVAAVKAVPEVRSPLLGVGELPALARYGFWLSLTHAFGALTGGVDDLVITGSCGAAVVPPWAIAKRLWLTAHTFLAQHTEHLIPTLGSLRHTARNAFDDVTMGMHWYVMLVSAMGYTLMAWCGEAIVGAVAGSDVAVLCQPPLFAHSLLGIGYALLIMPVVAALAEGASRPSFVVAMLSNSAQLAAVYWLARTAGAPAVYYAPLVALPVLLLATGTTSTSIFDYRSAWARLQPVLVPMAAGFVGVIASLAAPADLHAWQRMALGGLLAMSALLATIGVEKVFAVNAPFHAQLLRVARHAIDVISRSTSRIPGGIFVRHRTPQRPKQVPR